MVMKNQVAGIYTNEESIRLHEIDEKIKEVKEFKKKLTCWKAINDRQRQITKLQMERKKIHYRASARNKAKEETK